MPVFLAGDWSQILRGGESAEDVRLPREDKLFSMKSDPGIGFKMRAAGLFACVTFGKASLSIIARDLECRVFKGLPGS